MPSDGTLSGAWDQHLASEFAAKSADQAHLYWDQASVLVQVGLLDRALPVRGGETAAQVLNPIQPMNELIRRALEPSGHPGSR